MNNQNPNIYKSILTTIPKLNSLNLQSSVLENNGFIPLEYTKYGTNKMLPLNWFHINHPNIALYALICVDLHHVANQWVHLYIPKIAISKSSLNHKNLQTLNVSETIIGMNSFKERGYGGPCPPKGSGKHKYVFYLFALNNNASLEINENEKYECKNVAQFISMVGSENIIGYSTLSGYYESN
jgi:phosphatidylethanolamine-binding protein (PEBP) family uncharacterized protein